MPLRPGEGVMFDREVVGHLDLDGQRRREHDGGGGVHMEMKPWFFAGLLIKDGKVVINRIRLNAS